MTAEEIIEWVAQAREQGAQVAIEMPREGFWVQPDDVLKVGARGLLYWEKSSGTTYLIPASMVYLRFAEKGVA